MSQENTTNECAKREQSIIKALKEKAVEKRNEVSKLEQNSIEVQVQVADVKSKVQTSADHMIAIIEARKQDIFSAVDKQAKECLALRKGEVENHVKMTESALEETETFLKRSYGSEILVFNQTFDTILQEQGAQGKRDPECIPRFSFIESSKLLNILKNGGKGSVKNVSSKTEVRKSSSEAGVAEYQRENVRCSPFEVEGKAVQTCSLFRKRRVAFSVE